MTKEQYETAKRLEERIAMLKGYIGAFEQKVAKMELEITSSGFMSDRDQNTLHCLHSENFVKDAIVHCTQEILRKIRCQLETAQADFDKLVSEN